MCHGYGELLSMLSKTQTNGSVLSVQTPVPSKIEGNKGYGKDKDHRLEKQS